MGKNNLQDVPQMLGPLFNMAVPPTRKESDYINAYNGWVYAAVSLIAKEVSMVPLKLFRKRILKRNEIEIEEVHDHPALALLQSVNDFTTQTMHLELTQTYLELTGEAVWVLLRDQNNMPAQIWPLRPDWVGVKPSKTEFIDHYTYKPGGGMMSGAGFQEVKLDKEDVLFFKETNPMNPYRGMGRVQAGAMPIDIDQFSDDWNRSFFFNAALPYVVFTTDQKLKRAEIERFYQQWRSAHEGRKQAHKVAFLGGGFKADTISSSPKDLDFIESKKQLRDQILAMFHTSKANIGIIEDVNRANQEATDARFASEVIKPRVIRLVGFLNEFYLNNWEEEDLFFDFEDPVPEDTEQKLKLYENGLKNGWLTINEVREQENLEPVKGGDEIYLPIMIQPLSGSNAPATSLTDKLMGKQKPAETVLRLKAKKKTKQQKLQDSLNLPIPATSLYKLKKRQLKEGITHDLVKMIGNLMQFKTSSKSRKEEFKEAYWKNLIAKTDAHESRMIKMLQAAWEDQMQEVFNKLELDREGKSIEEDTKGVKEMLFNLIKENERLSTMFAPFMKELVQEQSEEVFDFLGLPRTADLTTEEAVRFLKTDGLKFVTQINTTTRKRLQKTLAAGLEAGEGIDALKQRVRDVYAQADDSRALTIARTEVMRATNFATELAYEQSELVTGKEWLTALDEKVDEDICAPMDGQIVPLGKSFTSGDGFPIDSPPAHPNCRCTTIPVISERAVPDFQRNIKEETESMKKEKLKEEVKLTQLRKAIKEKEAEVKKLEDDLKEKRGKRLSDYVREEQPEVDSQKPEGYTEADKAETPIEKFKKAKEYGFINKIMDKFKSERQKLRKNLYE